MIKLKLKIGRHTYDITESDQFMDNGACVQLLTQSQEAWLHSSCAHPVLSKRAIKEIATFNRVDVVEHAYCTEFSLGEK